MRDLPTPTAVYARLVASALAVGLVVCAAVVPVSALAEGGAGFRVTEAAWLAAALFGVLAVGALVAGDVVRRRTRPLYRALVRRCGTDGEAVPPSAAALRDAFDAPRWMAGTTVGFLAGALALHAAGALLWPGRLAEPSLVFDMVAAGMLAMGIPVAALLWRRAMWSWLAHVDPQDVPPCRAGLGARFGWLAAMPSAGVGLLCGAVLLGHGVPFGFFAVAAAGGVVAVVAAVLGARAVGRRVVRDLDVLGGAVADAPAAAAGAPPGGGPMRVPEVAALATRVRTLAEHHARLAVDEERARRAIEEVQQLKSRFMAYMSHDLRSPLNSIKGFAEILARETDGPLSPGQRESVDMIRESGDALLRLVNDILDSSKLEAGRLELQRRWIPSVEILTEAVRYSARPTGEESIRVVTELEPGLPPVYVDRERIVQAVAGVLSHVRDSMEGGTIRLRARVVPGTGDDRHLRVEVIDETASLGQADRERLFEAFRALREPSGRRIGGLGLRLSLARGLVAAHGGVAWLEPHGERGTAFCVSLPLTVGDAP
ncbi:MAG: sensor histidine kinase [Myxococcota bacterium]